MVKFSVLMSVYDGEKESNLNEALNSILAQSVLPTQLVIVEDGPLNVRLQREITNFEAFSTIDVTIVKLPNNVGLGLALREGLNFVKYSIVARADSDDFNVSDRFEIQLNEIIANSKLAILGTEIEEFVEKPTKTVSHKRMPHTSLEIRKYARLRNPFNHPSVMFRKSAIMAAGSYRDVRGFEDYDLWMRVIAEEKNSYVNLPQSLVYMRTSKEQMLRRGGFAYLLRYFKLKHSFFKQGFISKKDQLLSDFIMLVNAIIPGKLRRIVYARLLRK